MEPEFVAKQEKILKLFIHPEQIDIEADYYKVGKDYDIEAHIDDCSVSYYSLFKNICNEITKKYF